MADGDGGAELGAGAGPGRGRVAGAAEESARVLGHEEVGAVDARVAVPAKARAVGLAVRLRFRGAELAALRHRSVYIFSSNLRKKK